MAELKLAYWDIRGLAEPIRYLLHATGKTFEDKRYALTDKGDQWFNVDKPKLAAVTDFPNLPCYKDGDLILTQSLCIMRHLARKHGFVAKNDQDLIRVERAEQQAVDMRTAVVRLAHNHTNFDEELVKRKEALGKDLPLVEKFLGDRKFVAGDYLTYADLLYYDALDFSRLLVPEVFAPFKVIADYLKRIENVQGIKAYMESDQHKKRPLFSPYAVWGKEVIE